MKPFARQKGITLVEVILVMVVGMAILFFSLQQYLAFRRDANVRQLQANVDVLFNALGNYFYAHCNSRPFSNGSNSFVPVSRATLIAEGFLSDTVIPLNPLVNNAGSEEGYLMQLNLINDPNTGALPERFVKMGSGNKAVGKITIWQGQVSVRLNDPKLANQYVNILNAQCASTEAISFVLPCYLNSPGQVVVFERQPSFPTSKITNPYWAVMPNVKVFKQYYTVSPITYLTSGNLSNFQFFTCGS